MEGIDNLKPFKPGYDERRNLQGRPEGRRSLSVIIKDILENEIDWDLVPIKNAQELAQKYKNKKAWEALVYAAYAQAISGNTKAAVWLSKSGYGDKLDLTSGDKPIQPIAIYDLRRDGDTNDTGDNDETDTEHETSGSDASGQEPEV